MSAFLWENTYIIYYIMKIYMCRCLAIWLAGCDTAEFQSTSAMPTSCLLNVQLN